MYIFYLDESGNTGNDLTNKEQPIHFISGIGVKFDDISKIEKEIRQLEVNFLPYSTNFDFEFHAIEMVGGKKYFKNFDIAERLKAIDALVAIFSKYEIKFFSQGVNKIFLKSKYTNPFHPHYLSFMYLIEKIDVFLEKNSAKGLIIMDRSLETEQKIINNFQDYKQNGTTFGLKRNAISNLIDTVYYTDSYNSHIMQLSDVIGYIYATYRTFEFQNKLETSNYVRKKIFSLFEIIKTGAYYLDIEPKTAK